MKEFRYKKFKIARTPIYGRSSSAGADVVTASLKRELNESWWG